MKTNQEEEMMIESYICRSEILNDTWLERAWCNIEKTDVQFVAEVYAQKLALRHMIQVSLEKVKAVGERRFGKEPFEAACESAFEKLRKNTEILKALDRVFDAEPDRQLDDDDWTEAAEAKDERR